ncbi:Glucan endo-1,3-alpha-glucosidase agn1 [Neurospora sp. IMI 360204]|nr:Glucan endo-1,3-alpha-glucosidase agn1 [Neurospora sp. IMI 360204]
MLRTYKPDDHIGIYHGSIPFSGTGAVVVTLSRNGATIAQVDGKAIESGCTSSLYNAWVGSATAYVNGTGVNNFTGLYGFACEYIS